MNTDDVRINIDGKLIDDLRKQPKFRDSLSHSANYATTANYANYATSRASTPRAPSRASTPRVPSELPQPTEPIHAHGWTKQARSLVKLWTVQTSLNRRYHQKEAITMDNNSKRYKILIAITGSISAFVSFLNAAFAADEYVHIILSVLAGLFASLATLLGVVLAILNLDIDAEKNRQTAVQYGNISNEGQSLLVEHDENAMPLATDFLRRMKDLTYLIQLFGPPLEDKDGSDMPNMILMRGLDNKTHADTEFDAVFDNGEPKKKTRKELMHGFIDNAADIRRRRDELAAEEEELDELKHIISAVDTSARGIASRLNSPRTGVNSSRRGSLTASLASSHALPTPDIHDSTRKQSTTTGINSSRQPLQKDKYMGGGSNGGSNGISVLDSSGEVNLSVILEVIENMDPRGLISTLDQTILDQTILHPADMVNSDSSTESYSSTDDNIASAGAISTPNAASNVRATSTHTVDNIASDTGATSTHTVDNIDNIASVESAYSTIANPGIKHTKLSSDTEDSKSASSKHASSKHASSKHASSKHASKHASKYASNNASNNADNTNIYDNVSLGGVNALMTINKKELTDEIEKRKQDISRKRDELNEREALNASAQTSMQAYRFNAPGMASPRKSQTKQKTSSSARSSPKRHYDHQHSKNKILETQLEKLEAIKAAADYSFEDDLNSE